MHKCKVLHMKQTFNCTEEKCSFEAPDRRRLKVHHLSHDVDNNFKCNFCPYETPRKDELKRHIKKTCKKIFSPKDVVS